MYKFHHVTPHWNEEEILRTFLDPSRSRGKRKVTWYVDHSQLGWALAHTSSRWDVPVSSLVVFDVWVAAEYVARTCWQGVFTSRYPLVPFAVLPARDHLPLFP